MFKKTLVVTAVMMMTSSASFAGNFYAGPMALIETTTASDSNYRSLSPRLSLGYDQDMGSEFRLAAELFATPATLQITENTSTGAYNAKTSKSFGFSVLPAMMVSETVKGYARVGVISSKFTGPSTYATGLQVGLGMSSKLMDCWDIRAEYDYIAYRSVSNMGSPTADFFGVGLVYDLTNF